MAGYIGNQPVQAYSAGTQKDIFVPDGTIRRFAFQFNKPQLQASDVILVVNNVIQNPGSTYDLVDLYEVLLTGLTGGTFVVGSTVTSGANSGVVVVSEGSRIFVEMTAGLFAPGNVLTSGAVSGTVESSTFQDNRGLKFASAPLVTDEIYAITSGLPTIFSLPPDGSITAEKLSEDLKRIDVDKFTATAGQTLLILSRTPATADSVLVFVNGVFQTSGLNYTLSGTNLTFTEGLQLDDKVQVVYQVFAGTSGTNAEFVAIDDGVGGANYQTVQEYNEYLKSGSGASELGYLPPGTGAVATTVEKQFNNREVNLYRFLTDAEIADAKSGANAVDVAAKIIQAAQYANSVNAELVFPDGDYYFNASQSLNLADIRWRGDGDVTITFGDVTLDGVAPLLGTTTVAVDAPLGSLSVQLTDASLIQINAPIRLFNNTNGDTAYSYKKQGVYYVIAKSGNTVFLDRPLRFSFGAAEAGNLVQILNPDSYLGIKNIKFRKKVASGKIRACTFTFYSRVDLDDVDSINDVVESYGFGLTACAKVKINNPHTQGGTYPFMLGCCTDVKVNNITGREVHHPIDFNSFCDNCVVDGFDIQSVNGGINSHPSFNVWYMNGQTSDYNTASNHRVLGGGLKNVRITVGPNANTSMLFHDAFLADATTYTRARELGLTVEYDNVTIIDQRAGDNGFFPAKGYVSMRNIVSNKSVGFGDDVIEAQTENIAHGGTWRNRRTYKVTPKSNVIDAAENAGVFEIRTRSPRLEIDNQVVRLRGDLFRAKAGEPYNFTIKVFDGWAADLNSGRLVGKLKIKAQVRHSDAGSFDYLEKEYEFYHFIPATSGVTFPLTAIYTSGLSGVANESLAFTISNPLQAGATESAISTDWFFSIDVAMSSGRTSPFYSAQYELELRNVT